MIEVPTTDDVEDRYVYDPLVGTSETFSKWGTVAASPHLRVDDRADEAQSLTVHHPRDGGADRARRSDGAELLGPHDGIRGTDWVVKVTDVAPDGATKLITSATSAASHRRGTRRSRGRARRGYRTTEPGGRSRGEAT